MRKPMGPGPNYNRTTDGGKEKAARWGPHNSNLMTADQAVAMFLGHGFEFLLSICPRQQLIDIAVGMTSDDAREDVGQIRERVDVVQLAGLDRGRDGGPMFGAPVRAGEQRILPAERDRADGALDGVVVELDAAVIDEARQALPARQGITDGFSKLAFLADQAEFCAQPRLESVDQGAAFLGSDRSAFLGTSAPNIFLNRVEPGNPFERFAGDRCRTSNGELIKPAPNMRPAERKADVAAIGQLAVAGITVDLQNALEALHMGDWPFRFAIGCVDVNGARWVTATPWPIVSG